VTGSGPRSQELDVLRAAAVTAVLVEHAPFKFSGIAGWTGVDLFFVLSGFLVSGLLFAEQRSRRHVAVGRFLVRRGFKIYPAFYALLAATIAIRLLHSGTVPRAAALSELLFVQNYGPRLWMHTWSLAVEEHFYFALAFVLGLLARSGREDAFRRVPLVAAAVAVVVLAARTAFVYVWRPPFEMPMYATHFRIDALLCGVAIAYAFHYHREWLDARLTSSRTRAVLWIVGGVCLAPVLTIPPDRAFVLGPGLTLSYLGYGCALLLMLPSAASPGRAPRWMRPVAFVGRHSYSIYLWHVPILLWVVAPLGRGRFALWEGRFWPAGAAFVIVAIAGGIFMARVIELPALALRDRIWPRPADAAPLAVQT
jgi:peptidoglycan/LPS O-acetylase OafA/YrhL